MPLDNEEFINIVINAYLKDQAKMKKEVDALAQYIKRKAQEMNTSFRTVGDGMKSAFGGAKNKQINEAVRGLEAVDRASKKAGKGLFSLNNIARTVLGTFTAMGVFLVTQFVGNTAKKVLDSLKQMELAMYNLAVAEKTMSQRGVDIAPQDFQDIIKSIKELDLALSDADIAQGVAEIATGLQDLGLSKEQLANLSEASAIIAEAEGLTFLNVAEQLAQGLPKGGRGLADLDIQVDNAVIKQKALEAGLVESEEAWNNLDAVQRQNIETQALYLIVLDSAQTKLEEMSLLEDTAHKATKELSSAWENFTTYLGQASAPMLIGLLQLLTKFVVLAQVAAVGWGIGFAEFVAGMAGIKAVWEEFKANPFTLTREDAQNTFQEYFSEARKIMLAELFPTGIPEIEGFGGGDTSFLPEQPDTPTGDVPDPNAELAESQGDLQKALEKMNNEILEQQIRLAQDMEEAQIDLGRKLVDIATEYAKKRADAEREYSNTVSDIQSDYANGIAGIEADQAEDRQKSRNEELQREAEFQNEMQELKENYLMDLEEALQARDARAVLRLTKQYNLDKLQAERERELERQNSQRKEAEARAGYQRRRRDAERERKAKLAEAKREHEEKLAQLKADEEAEKKQAELDYQRKLEDLNREMYDRLEILGASLIAEFNLTKDGLNAILELYSRYYSEIAGIYNAMNTMLNSTPTPSPSGYSPNSQYQGGDYTAPNNHIGGHIAFAEGGSMIANKPTKAVFGDNGLELATFTPLDKSGKNVNKLFSNMDTSGGVGGKTVIEVLLSPDLEGRIVTNSLNQTAEIIQQINRSK